MKKQTHQQLGQSIQKTAAGLTAIGVIGAGILCLIIEVVGGIRLISGNEYGGALLLAGVVFFFASLIAIAISGMVLQGLGALVEDCAYLPAIAKAVGAVPAEEELAESNQKETDSQNTKNSENATDSENTPTTVAESTAKPATLEIPAFVKNNNGKKIPTEEILSTALACRSDYDLLYYLKDFSSDPFVHVILRRSDSQIRPTLRNILNQMNSDPSES